MDGWYVRVGIVIYFVPYSLISWECSFHGLIIWREGKPNGRRVLREKWHRVTDGLQDVLRKVQLVRGNNKVQ